MEQIPLELLRFSIGILFFCSSINNTSNIASERLVFGSRETLNWRMDE